MRPLSPPGGTAGHRWNARLCPLAARFAGEAEPGAFCYAVLGGLAVAVILAVLHHVHVVWIP